MKVSIILRSCQRWSKIYTKCEILSVILQSDISRINLGYNNIDSLGAIKIAEYLVYDPPIEELCLRYNQLNDDDVILISQALKRNTNLHRMFLHSNNITSIGAKALFTCVFDGSNLNAISESNHTLKKNYMFWTTGWDDWLQVLINCLT
jgi:hypothetical protein